MKFEWTIKKRRGRWRPRLTVKVEFTPEEQALNALGRFESRIKYFGEEKHRPGHAGLNLVLGWAAVPEWDNTASCYLAWQSGVRPEYPEVVAELSRYRTSIIEALEAAYASELFEESDTDEFRLEERTGRMVSTRHPSAKEDAPRRRIKVAQAEEEVT